MGLTKGERFLFAQRGDASRERAASPGDALGDGRCRRPLPAATLGARLGFLGGKMEERGGRAGAPRPRSHTPAATTVKGQEMAKGGQAVSETRRRDAGAGRKRCGSQPGAGDPGAGSKLSPVPPLRAQPGGSQSCHPAGRSPAGTKPGKPTARRGEEGADKHPPLPPGTREGSERRGIRSASGWEDGGRGAGAQSASPTRPGATWRVPTCRGGWETPAGPRRGAPSQAAAVRQTRQPSSPLLGARPPSTPHNKPQRSPVTVSIFNFFLVFFFSLKMTSNLH